MAPLIDRDDLSELDELLMEEQQLLDGGPSNDTSGRMEDVLDQLELTARIMRIVLASILGLSALLTFCLAFFDVADARFVARAGSMFTAIPAIFWAGASSLASILRRRWVRAVAAALMLVPAAALILWLGPSPGAYFPWETRP